MRTLTADQIEVLLALAQHGGGAKTRSELTMHSTRICRMGARARDEALRVLVARGLAEPVPVRQSTPAPYCEHCYVTVRDGWRLTDEGREVLARAGEGVKP